MNQKNKFIKERLKHKQEQLSMQAIRQERLNRTMQNTKDDIDQLIYALHELEEAEKFCKANPMIDAYFIYSGENGEFKTYYTDGMKRYMPDAK